MEIRVKIFSKEDVPERVLWINDPSIYNNMYFEIPATISKTENWYESIKNNPSRIDFSFIDSNNNYLAMGGFTSIDKEHQNAEFYIMVNPNCQGKGIGGKVSQWMYNYAFSNIKLNKIYLFTNNNNTKAYKIYENSGFVLEGIQREHKKKDNVFLNRRIYSLLHSEWNEMPWKKTIKDEVLSGTKI